MTEINKCAKQDQLDELNKKEFKTVKEDLHKTTEELNWFKEKSDLIKLRFEETDQAMKNYVQEQTSTIQDLLEKKVHQQKIDKIAVKELKDAKSKINAYTESTMMLQMDLEERMKEASDLKVTLDGCERKYSSTSRENETFKSAVKEHQKARIESTERKWRG